MVQVGENLVSIETDEEAGDGDSDAGPAPSAASPAAHSSPEDPAPPSATPSRVLTSPAVRHLARQHSLDLAQVRASGPGGRLTKADVQAHLDSLSAAATSTVAADVAAAVPTTEAAAVRQAVPEQRGTGGDAAAGRIPAAGAGTTAGAGGGTTTVPLRGFRKAMVKSMAAAGAVPHFHFCEEVQMDALVALRALLRTEAVLGGAKLTYMPFFIKACWELGVGEWRFRVEGGERRAVCRALAALVSGIWRGMAWTEAYSLQPSISHPSSASFSLLPPTTPAGGGAGA